MSFVLLVSNLRPFTPVSSRNCPHSSQSICPSHFESEADKVQRPRQILLKVSTLGLDAEKYTQIAVVLVSAKCSPDHRECTKCVSEYPEAIKCPNFLGSHFVSPKML